jgi:response regulator of citrate/malate metabolism
VALAGFLHLGHTFSSSRNEGREEMPGMRKGTMDIREILRRLRKSQSDRAVARALGVDCRTVGRYRNWAAEQGLLEGCLPPLSELH